MSKNIGVVGSRCSFCGRSTSPRTGGRRPRAPLRSYELSEQYIDANPHVQAYAHHRLGREGQLGPSERICRPCVQRASRYHTRERAHSRPEAMSIVNPLNVEDSVKENDFERNESSENGSDPKEGHGDDFGPDPQEGIPDGDFKEVSEELNEDGKDLEVVPKEPNQGSKDFKAVPQKPNQGTATSKIVKQDAAEIPILGYTRVPSTTTFCLIAGCKNRDLHRVRASMRASILAKDNIFIPAGARTCKEHMDSAIIWQNLADYTHQRHDLFSPLQIAEMLNLLRKSL